MKKIGKILALALCGCMMLTMFAGCGDKEEQTTIDLGAAKEKIAALTYQGEEGEEKLMGELDEPSEKVLSSMYSIQTGDLQEYAIAFSDEGMYMILLPAEGKENDVKNGAAQAIDVYGKQFEMYFPEKYDMVQKRKETIKGNYLIYIASRDNDAVMAAIDEATTTK